MAGGKQVEPRVEETLLLRKQAMSMYQAQGNDIAAKLRQPVTAVE